MKTTSSCVSETPDDIGGFEHPYSSSPERSRQQPEDTSVAHEGCPAEVLLFTCCLHPPALQRVPSQQTAPEDPLRCPAPQQRLRPTRGPPNFEISLKSATKQLRDTQREVQHSTWSARLWVNPFVRRLLPCFIALSSTCLPCTEQLKAAPRSRGFGSARLSPCSPSQPLAGYPGPTVRNKVILARTCRCESEINICCCEFINQLWRADECAGGAARWGEDCAGIAP